MISCVVPCWHEAESAPEVVRDLRVAARRADRDLEVIVIDDTPSGKSAAACRRVASGDDLRCIVRPDGSGLASAVARGLREARGDRLVVLDGDGQHRAVDAIAVGDALDSADVAVGSRHVGDGRNNSEWGLSRTITSAGAAGLAWAAVPESRCLQDATSGLFGVRRDVVAPVVDDLDPTGFKVLLEVLAVAPVNSVAEVPIQFRPRRGGESGLGGGEIVDYVRHLSRLAVVSRRPTRPSRRHVVEPEVTS